MDADKDGGNGDRTTRKESGHDASSDRGSIPCTVIKAGPCDVTQIKTVDRRIRGGADRPRRGEAGRSKPLAGHFKKAGVPPTRVRGKSVAAVGDALEGRRPGAVAGLHQRRPRGGDRHEPRPRVPGRHAAPQFRRRRGDARLDVPPRARARSAPRRILRAWSRACAWPATWAASA